MSANVSSTSNSSSRYSYLQTANGRYSGLASGIDTESVVEKLMKAQSTTKEKLQQQYQTFEWKRDSYRDFYSKLSSLRDELYDNYALTSNWSAKKASSSDPSVSVSATSSATGSLTISNINLATNSTNPGSQLTNVNSSTTTLNDLDNSINGNGYFTLNVLQNDGQMKATTIKYSSTDTIDTFIKNINNSKAGVTAIFSNNTLSLTTNATGENPDSLNSYATEIISTPPTDPSYIENTNIFSAFGISKSANGGLVKNGTNASVKVNGITMTPTSNTFTLNGYNLTLNNNNNTANVTISSSADVDAVVDKVKSFVKSYNDITSSMRTATTEKKNLGYPPLTDAQKAEMSESEIAAWEKKAKAGILKSDNYLSDVTSSLRSTMSSKIGQGTYNYLFQIGVTTTKIFTDGGKLQIDEAKLRKAIETDPDSVVNMFTGTDGLVSKIRPKLKSGMDSIEKVAGTEKSNENTYSLGTQMISLKSKINDWTDRLKDIENRYWNQFTAMETAVSKANSVQSMFA